MTSSIFRKPEGCLGWSLRILLIGVILLVVLLLAGNAVQRRATKADFEKFPAPGQLVEVDGHDMHIFCQVEAARAFSLIPVGVDAVGLGEGLLPSEIRQMIDLAAGT